MPGATSALTGVVSRSWASSLGMRIGFWARRTSTSIKVKTRRPAGVWNREANPLPGKWRYSNSVRQDGDVAYCTLGRHTNRLATPQRSLRRSFIGGKPFDKDRDAMAHLHAQGHEHRGKHTSAHEADACCAADSAAQTARSPRGGRIFQVRGMDCALPRHNQWRRHAYDPDDEGG